LDMMQKLSKKWNVSKSEVIRRAVKKAQEDDIMKASRMSPVEALEWIQNGGGLNEREAKFITDEVAAERAAKKYWWEENDSTL
jgi:Arc/MetJ-type ribon-helix-helix transcriptional regulator